jgi:hypothetical protein
MLDINMLSNRVLYDTVAYPTDKSVPVEVDHIHARAPTSSFMPMCARGLATMKLPTRIYIPLLCYFVIRSPIVVLLRQL